MKTYATPVAELKRQLDVIEKEIVQHQAELRFLSSTQAVSAAHAVRRAELASRIRANLEWLEPKRDEMRAELGAHE